ncbi:hypothetical protein ACWD0D_24825, partial [Streptomyces griseoincarnatus]
MTGSISSGTPSSSITQRLLPTCPRVRTNLTACPRDLAKGGDHRTRLLPVEEDGTLTAEASDSVVK